MRVSFEVYGNVAEMVSSVYEDAWMQRIYPLLAQQYAAAAYRADAITWTHRTHGRKRAQIVVFFSFFAPAFEPSKLSMYIL